MAYTENITSEEYESEQRRELEEYYAPMVMRRILDNKKSWIDIVIVTNFGSIRTGDTRNALMWLESKGYINAFDNMIDWKHGVYLPTEAGRKWFNERVNQLEVI